MMGISSDTSMVKHRFSTPVTVTYGIAATMGLTVYHGVAGGQYSSILTLSALVQCLGVCFLCMQVILSGSAEGISARSVILDIVAVVFRLSSTLWLNGYLPVDASGDYLYQAIDVCSLLLMVWLLHRVLVIKRRTYLETEDSFNIGPMVLAALFLATLFHGDMDDRPLFDIFWMTGLFTSVVAVMPQLWLIMQTGGKADAMTCHYIAALALSRILSGLFMWEARYDITCNEWIMKGFSHGIVAILVAHLIHLLLVADFAYYYVRSLMQNGPMLPISMKSCDAQWV